ncbi:hypothetical protein QTP88_005875 [Uroleucon formosanum]
MKRKDSWTDEEGCGTVDFVQIELQRGKTLLLDVKIRVSALLYRSLSRIKHKLDCKKRTESPSPVFNISSFCVILLFRTCEGSKNVPQSCRLHPPRSPRVNEASERRKDFHFVSHDICSEVIFKCTTTRNSDR